MRKNSTKKKTNHSYIVCDEAISGGVPIIKGTRIRVIQVTEEYTKLGYSPEDIVKAHPHLNLAQIHDALSYYYEHKEKFDKRMEESLREYEEMKKNHPSKLKAHLESRVYAENL